MVNYFHLVVLEKVRVIKKNVQEFCVQIAKTTETITIHTEERNGKRYFDCFLLIS